jgi:hypothetical protein
MSGRYAHLSQDNAQLNDDIFPSEVSLYLSEFILVASSVSAEIFVDKIYKTSPSINHCTIQCLNLFFPSVSRLHLEPKGNMSQVGYI